MWSWLDDFNPFLLEEGPPSPQAAAAAPGALPVTPQWVTTLRGGGTVPRVDPMAGAGMGWSTPPGNNFVVRGRDYPSSKAKVPAQDSILQPLGFDWLSSASRIDNIMEHPNNRVMVALDKALSESKLSKPFVWVFNLQVPSLDHLSAIAYFVTTEQFAEGSLVSRFLKGDNEFRVSRLKLIANIFKGPWVVKAAVGEQAICILGKALTCRFAQSEKFMNIDVDIGSSMVATAVVQLAIGYVTTLTVDLAFLIEGQTADELPERLLGSIRLHNLELQAAAAIPALDFSRRGAFSGLEESRTAGETSVVQASLHTPRGDMGTPPAKSKCARFLATLRGTLTCFSPSKCAP